LINPGKETKKILYENEARNSEFLRRSPGEDLQELRRTDRFGKGILRRTGKSQEERGETRKT